MHRLSVLTIFVSLVFVAGCGQTTIVHDFSTPEGAILCLEDAYRAKDLEAAVRCKDFQLEARAMSDKIGASKEVINDEIIKQLAVVLELAYRNELKQKGFPDMSGVTCTFPSTETQGEGLVIVTEECTYADGQKSRERLLVGQTANGWRVLNPVDESPTSD
jgi:hypothetical protein